MILLFLFVVFTFLFQGFIANSFIVMKSLEFKHFLLLYLMQMKMGKNISFESKLKKQNIHIFNNLLRTTVGNYFKNFFINWFHFHTSCNHPTKYRIRSKTLTSMKHHVSLKENPKHYKTSHIYKTHFKAMI